MLLSLDIYASAEVVRAMFIVGALHGVEASALSEDGVRSLRSDVVSAVWSRRQPSWLLHCLVYFPLHEAVFWLKFLSNWVGFIAL